MKFRNRFSTERVPQPQSTPSRTKQEFKAECDINRIVERAKRGLAPAFNPRKPFYGDFSNVPTLTEAFARIEEAQEAFMTLPAQLRRELGNDPRNISDLTVEQCERYGLMKEKAPDAGDGGTPPSPGQGARGVADPSNPPAKPAKKPKADNSDQE